MISHLRHLFAHLFATFLATRTNIFSIILPIVFLFSFLFLVIYGDLSCMIACALEIKIRLTKFIVSLWPLEASNHFRSSLFVVVQNFDSIHSQSFPLVLKSMWKILFTLESIPLAALFLPSTKQGSSEWWGEGYPWNLTWSGWGKRECLNYMGVNIQNINTIFFLLFSREKQSCEGHGLQSGQCCWHEDWSIRFKI